MQPEKESIVEFFNLYNLTNAVKKNTSFKTSDKPTCIGLILTNCPSSFQNSDTFETKLSGFHKVTLLFRSNIFQNKNLKKLFINSIIKRSKLHNDFLKDRNDNSESAYRKQHNLRVTLS